MPLIRLIYDFDYIDVYEQDFFISIFTLFLPSHIDFNYYNDFQVI